MKLPSVSGKFDNCARQPYIFLCFQVQVECKSSSLVDGEGVSDSELGCFGR